MTLTSAECRDGACDHAQDYELKAGTRRQNQMA
jgi:hypothetical protein